MNIDEQRKDVIMLPTNNGYIQVATIDSCEYIIFDNYDGGGICHKGNCKYCEARTQK